jgi:prevent-host-death family protein
MQTVPINQAKDRFSALLQAVEEGDEIVITRHGRRIARIVRETEPAAEDDVSARVRQRALDSLRAFADRLPSDPLYQKGDWKQLRDAGRR